MAYESLSGRHFKPVLLDIRPFLYHWLPEFRDSGLISRDMAVHVLLVSSVFVCFRAFRRFYLLIIDPTLVEDFRRLWSILTTLAIIDSFWP